MVIIHFDHFFLRSPVKKSLQLPGSKYLANRILILATLAKGKSIIKNLPQNQDTNTVINEIASLGFIKKKGKSLEVVGNEGKINIKKKKFYTHDNGTFSRFLLTLLSLGKEWVTISGSDQMNQRPMKDLVEVLKSLGVKIKNNNQNSTLPLTLKGPLVGGKCELSGNLSSQFFSALLLVLPLLENNSEIKIKGELVSEPYIFLTIQLMQQFKVKVTYLKKEKKFLIKGSQTYQAQKIVILPDNVLASYFIIWAGMAKKTLTIQNYDFNSPQGETKFINDLKQLNLPSSKVKKNLLVQGKKNYPPRQEEFTFDFKDKPDVVQTFLVFLISLNLKKVTIQNIAHLRYKETNRVENTVRELKKCNINITANKNSFILKKTKEILPAFLFSHHDHRMVMSLSMLALLTDFITIKNEEAVQKTCPNYFDYLKNLGFKVTFWQKKVTNLVLIGFRGSGKSTLAKELALKLNFPIISSDEIFEKENGAIDEFVKKHGWTSFRKKENKICQTIASKKAIIDLGGGVVEVKKNLNYFKNSLIIFLEVDYHELLKRLKKSPRPSLGKNLKKIYNQRFPQYFSYADFRIRNTNLKRSVKIIKNIWLNFKKKV